MAVRKKPQQEQEQEMNRQQVPQRRETRRTQPGGGMEPALDPLDVEGMAVRTGEADEAYRMGQREGAQALINDANARLGILPADETITQDVIGIEDIEKAESILLKYKDGKSEIEQRIIEAQEWWKLKNWEIIKSKKGTRGATTYKGSTGWLWNCIVGKHADMMDSYPEPIILPRMQDDKQEAEMLSKIIPVILSMNHYRDTYDAQKWQKLTEGTGGEGVFWNKDKLNGLGDVEIRKINLLNLFWEPGINDIQESRNVFYVTEMDREEFLEMHPDMEGQIKPTKIQINKYRNTTIRNEPDKVAVIDWYYKKWNGTKKVLHYCQFACGNILYSSENAGETEGWYHDGKYPFVLDELFPIEGQPTGYGYIDIGRDAQIDIDELNQAMVLNAKANAVPRLVTDESSGINEQELTDYSKPVIHAANATKDNIIFMQSKEMGATTFNMLQQKIDELKFITGNTDVQNGGVPSGVTAASAIAALKEDAGRTSKDTTQHSYSAYNRLIEMVIERIRQFYDIPRFFRIIGRDGSEQFVQYSNEKLKPQLMEGAMGLQTSYRLPLLDIDVRAQRENAYTKMSQNELAIQFYQLGFFNPQLADQAMATLEMMDFKGKEEIRQRIQMNGTMMEALMQVGQIALELANQYRPEVAQMLALTLQGIGAEVGAGAPRAAGRLTEPIQAAKSNDAMGKPENPNENKIVKRARERAQNANRPD